MDLAHTKQTIDKIKQGLVSAEKEIEAKDYKSAIIVGNDLVKDGLDLAKNSQNLKISRDALRESKDGIVHQGYPLSFKNLNYIIKNLSIVIDHKLIFTVEQPGVNLAINYKGIDMADDVRVCQFNSNGDFDKMVKLVKQQVKKQIKVVENDLHNILVEIDHREHSDSKMKPIKNGYSLQTMPEGFMKYITMLMTAGFKVVSFLRTQDLTEGSTERWQAIDQACKMLADDGIYVDKLEQLEQAVQLP